MGKRAGLALKSLQWALRAIEFCCAAVLLAIFSYFLASLVNHHIHVATWVRAVEGISGAAALYTIIGLLLLCFVAGHTFFSLIAIILDICFVGAFVYLAVANRHGASSCRGHVNTVFGSGNASSNVRDPHSSNWTELPTLRTACRLQTACFSVAIIGTLFFLLSALVEFALWRHHRKEKRFGPGPNNDYTEGYGQKRRGFLSFGRKRNNAELGHDGNALPTHNTPADVRDSYATEQTRVGTSHGHETYNKYGESGYNTANQKVAPPAGPPPATHGHHNTGTYENSVDAQFGTGVTGSGPGTSVVQTTDQVHYPTANYRYDDGTYNAR